MRRHPAASCNFGDPTASRAPFSKAIRAKWSGLAWSPDSQRLCAGSSEGNLRVWTVAGQTFGELVGHQKAIKWLAFSPDGSRLAALDAADALTLWDWQHEKQLFHPESAGDLEPIPAPMTAAWSPDGRWLSVGASSRHVRLWQAEDGAMGPVLSSPPNFPEGFVTVITQAWHPDGKTLLAGSSDATLSHWDIESAEVIQAFPQRLARPTALAWSTDGKRLVVGTTDRAIHLWNADTGRPEGILGRHGGRVRVVAWQPGRQRLASIGDDAHLRLWDADFRRQEADVEIDADLLAMAWSPDGQCLATGDSVGLVRVHDAVDGTVLRSLNTQSATISGLDWSPSGKLIATVSNAKVTIIDAGTGGQALTFKGDDILNSVAWSPDGKQLATASHVSLRLWDAGSGEPGPVFSGWSGYVQWSRERALLADRSGRLVRLIDVSTEQPVRILDGHAGGVSAISLDPTAGRIATAGGDHVLHVWDIDQGRPLWTAVLLFHDRVAVFSAAGELLHADPGAEDELVYLVDKEDGAREVLTPAEFRERIDGKLNQDVAPVGASPGGDVTVDPEAPPAPLPAVGRWPVGPGGGQASGPDPSAGRAAGRRPLAGGDRVFPCLHGQYRLESRRPLAGLRREPRAPNSALCSAGKADCAWPG